MDAYFMSVDVLMEVEDMGFDDGLDFAEGGRVCDGGDGVVDLGGAIERDMRDIRADLGNDLVGCVDVSRGKAECVSAMGAGFDGAVERVGFAEHRVGFVDEAVLQSCADAAGADGEAAVRLHDEGVEGDVVLGAVVAQ